MESASISEGVVTIRILFILIPILMGTVHSIWRRKDLNFSKTECFLTYFLVIGVGLQGLIVGHLQIYHSEVVANYVGWPDTPFLSDLGKATMAFGILGILSFWFKGGWRSATALGYALNMTMASFGHYRYFIYENHPHTDTLEPLILTTAAMAACLYILLFLRSYYKT